MKVGGRFFVILCMLLAFASAAPACTVFFLKSRQGPLMARNFDFPLYDAFIARNGRGVSKVAFVAPPTPPLRWVSKFGSITINQAGYEFPTEGMNEEGLAVAALIWDKSALPAVETRPAVSQLQFVQYLLDNYANVQDVVASVAALPVVKLAVPLHFSVCDARECAVIEWLDGKATAFIGATLPIRALANDGYANSCRVLASGASAVGSIMDRTRATNLRFKGAAEAVAESAAIAEADLIRHAYRGLDAVSQYPFTQWQTIFEPAMLTFETRRSAESGVGVISLSGMDFSDPRPAHLDFDAAMAKGTVQPADFVPALPGSYCANLVNALALLPGMDIDPRLMQALPLYGHRLHPSSRPH